MEAVSLETPLVGDGEFDVVPANDGHHIGERSRFLPLGHTHNPQVEGFGDVVDVLNGLFGHD